MTLILTWLAIQIPLGILVGHYIKAGRGDED